VAVHAGAAILTSLAHMLAIGAAPLGDLSRLVGGYYDPFGPLGDWPYELAQGRPGLCRRSSPSTWSGRTLRSRGQSAEERSTGLPGSPRPSGARRHFVPLTDVVWVEAEPATMWSCTAAALAFCTGLPLIGDGAATALGRAFVRHPPHSRSGGVARRVGGTWKSKPTGDFVVRLRDGRELAGSRRYRRPLLPIKRQ